MNWLVKNGTLVEADGLTREDLLIKDGMIIQRGADLQGDYPLIDAAGLKVLPGLLDMHVHLREPGYEYKETIRTGVRAAVLGGFTAVAAMPNTDPVTDSAAVVERVLAQAAREGLAEVYPLGAVTKGQEGETLSEMADLARAGVRGFSDDGRPVADAALMRHALEYAGMLGLMVISHCEDTQLSAGGAMHEGYWSTVLGLKGIPAAAEEVMVARDICLAELTGSPLHLAHLSTAGSVRLVREAKKRGLKVTAEATPHHFSLTDAAVKGYDTSTKVNPPLRSEEDRLAVVEGLKDGTIDCIASDHAPHAPEEKDREYDYAPFGISGLETALPLTVTKLVLPGIISWERLVQLMSLNPRKILGLPGGTLKTGQAADLTIVDDGEYRKVDRASFASRGKNTPFQGWEITGWPVYTMVKGRLVVAGGSLKGAGNAG